MMMSNVILGCILAVVVFFWLLNVAIVEIQLRHHYSRNAKKARQQLRCSHPGCDRPYWDPIHRHHHK
jgi:hypothetical protein